MGKKLSEEEKKKIKRILVIQTAFIGDVILVTPLIAAIKKIFSQSLIDVLLIPQTADLLDNNPKINSILLFDKRKNKFLAFLKTLKILRDNKYDLAISPHSSVTTALLIYFSGIPIKVGFARWISQILLTHKLPHLKNTFKIKKNLYLLSPFSDEEFLIQTELFPSEKMYEKAKNILSALKVNCEKIVAVAPGSNWFTKRWPKEHFEQLVKKLSDLNYGIIFIGSKEERDLCEEINPQKNYVNLAGELSLLESAAVISFCDLMICNDSGALHIADAMQIDLFAFFGPTVKSIGYFPFRGNDKVFEVDLDCRPCSSHGTNACPLGHHNCMRFIEPDFVVSQVLKKFEV